MLLPAGRAQHAGADLRQLAEYAGSVSISVETGRPVLGHLIITELMENPSD